MHESMEMEPNYTVIGTTNRSDPVNSMELLYPNGFNRNDNRPGRPLVQVQDTAQDDDDFEDDDFGFTYGSSPSENVTVTIKFSSKTDSVVAETNDTKTGEIRTSSTTISRPVASVSATNIALKRMTKSPVNVESDRTKSDIDDANQRQITSEKHIETLPIEDNQLLGACAMDEQPEDVVSIQEKPPPPPEYDDSISKTEYVTIDEKESQHIAPIIPSNIVEETENDTTNIDIQMQPNRSKGNNTLNTIDSQFTGTCAIDKSNIDVEPETYDTTNTVVKDKRVVTTAEIQLKEVSPMVDVLDQAKEDSPVERTQDSLYDEYEKMLEPQALNDVGKVENTQIKSKLLFGRNENGNDSTALSSANGKEAKQANGIGEENNTSDCKKKMAVKTPANVRPDCRLEMVSPITKTPIFVERSPSEEDDGEDFMNYLKELKKTSSAVVTEPDDTSDTSDMKSINSPQRSSTPEMTRKDGEFSIVEIDDSVPEEISDNSMTNVDVIEISDEDDLDDSVIYVSGDETKKPDLLNFNFASLRSNQAKNQPNKTNHAKYDGSKAQGRTSTDSNSVIEIDSDSHSDTDDEEEDEEDNEKDKKPTKPNKNDKDGDSDTDKGNGPTNGSSGSNHGNDAHGDGNNENGQSDRGNNNDNEGSSKQKFSPGMRCRQSDLFLHIEHDASLPANSEHKVPPNDRELYSPEDMEVLKILDVCEKQSDVQHQFQTIDSYCFETSSDISSSTADKISLASQDTDISKCQSNKYERSRNSNSVASIASTSSFDIFADSSNHSQSDIEENELDISLYDNLSEHDDTVECANDISAVCAKIQTLCQSQTGEERVDLDVPINGIDTVSLFSDSDSDSSELNEEDVVNDFESAIEEQFWTNTADCSLASSDIDASNTDGESKDDSFDENKYADKIYSTDEKESESEYESADDDDDNGDDDNENESELDFMKEIEARLPTKSEETHFTAIDSVYRDKGEIDSNIRNTSKESDKLEFETAETFSDSDGFDTAEFVPTDLEMSSVGVDDDKKEEVVKDSGVNENQTETRTRREIITASLNSKPRTIVYQIPYIKMNEIRKLDHKHMGKLKFICKLRQFKLNKVLPKHTDTNNESIDTDEDLEISESVKHFKDEIDVEMKNKNNHVKNKNIEKNNKATKLKKNKATKLKPGDTFQLGQGYYILGTGDNLNIPIGPTPRQKAKYKESTVPRSSIYFRGIPGIINNAYKMSNSFPKLGLPNESASHKILHACNRLVTPQSPGKSKAKPELKHGMMQHSLSQDDPDENEDTDSSTASEMYEVLLSAKDLLNSSRFDEAETTFLKLYNEIQEKPDHNGRLLVETLTGLADICIRQSRMCRSNPLEWQWLCMHAIALLQYIVEYCESELENQLDNELIDWYQEHRQASELKCRPLEDAFNRALYNCLKHDSSQFDPFQSFSLPNTPVQPNRKSNLFPLSSTMPQYLVMPGMSYRVTDKGLTRHSADDSNVAVDWLAKFQHYCKDRLVNKDSKGVTEKILKSNSSRADDDTESILSAGSDGSLDWDHTDLQGIDEISMDITDQETSPENDYTFEYEIVTSDTEKEGWDFFINQRRNCNFESVVQMAVHGDKGEERPRDTKAMTKEARDIYQLEKSEKAKQKFIEAREIISPLHEHSISLTLARLFCRLADKLVQEEEYHKAEAVYEKILDIVDRIQDGTAGMLRFSARIMKNLGTVKSKQGKSSSGLVLLNKALHTYRDLQDDEANFEIAIALIELGNGYIVGKNHEDCVFSYVIIAICDFFEKDSGDTQTASTSSAGSASQLSQMTSSFGSTNNEDSNVEEAVTCYTEAITLLDRYEADEKQVDMFAKAVMRLGDCYFMQTEYDKALECYEKSLTMFRTNNMFGKVSLMENAHVLCMLGVSSFMLHVYPRAASVFEMALHMVRCAYGYKRTFLNGMLQSLAGITYYKMKNYHKCVSMCYQAYETYCEIFGDEMPRLDKQKFWLVCQTLYVMGNSYNILNLQAKAMKYLTIARSLMKSSKSRERRQFMRVLQILGDAYFAQYDYKTALTYYNEALEYGECESQISFDEVFDPNCASDEMTIHNHLVSKSAEAHLSMQQYQNAVHYLEQAHDMQEVMGEDIKEDLINTLNQLGYMHSVSGDVNKAIEAYKECLEVFREIHEGKLGPEMCTTLGNLGAMCYVKACIAEDPREDRAMTASADDYFQNAMTLELNTEVCVKYGNFLYSQCKYQDAIFHLNNALMNDKMATDIVYGGLEKVTLPELLQDEVDTQEEICLPSSCLARYLLILCHKALHQTRAADDNLVGLMEEVNDYGVPLLHSVLGYAMMELMLFQEAAICFLNATENEDDYQLANENYCICLLILVQKALKDAIENIWSYYRLKGNAIGL